MKRFAVASLLFSLVLAMLFALAFVLMPPGMIGDVYARVSSPRQQSLVVGTSRAAQAVNPATINEKLRGVYAPELYNFSFHLDASSYNEVYARAVMNKLDAPRKGRHLFILAVDPWSLRRLDSIPMELSLSSVAAKPNAEYLVKNFTRSWFSPLPRHSYVNEYGRTEVDYTPRSQAEWLKRVSMRMPAYEKMARNYEFSAGALLALEDLARSLKSRGGDVYLVRISTSRPMMDLENKVCPDFSARMRKAARRVGAVYLDFGGAKYATTDGNHLTMAEGDRFSAALADSIKVWAIRQ